MRETWSRGISLMCEQQPDAEDGVMVMKDKRKAEKQVQADGIDLVDWFLAIDACRA